jgi:hypothetical protein
MEINYEILVNDLIIETTGVASNFSYEFRVKVNHSSLIEEAKDFLEYVISYLYRENKKINPGETLAYGYWLTKFEQVSEKILEVFEYNDNATSFVEGASRALTYWRDQNAVCRKYNVAFSPPQADRKVAISEGVYGTDFLEGVRYPSPEHMSGWWLTTDRYNGDIKTLKVVHLYHVTSARPEIAKYLALPAGWYFRSDGDVWFDSKIASQ